MSIQKLYKAKSLQSLNTELLNLLHTQMNVRMQLKMGQINHTHLLKRIRRDIARVKTCLSNGMRSHNNV